MFFNVTKSSAKLCALCAKNVLTCQRALRAYVVTCKRAFACLHADVPTCLACLRVHMPMCLACLLDHVVTCLPCLRAHVPTCLGNYVLTCQCASFDATIFSFAPIVAEVVHTVGIKV